MSIPHSDSAFIPREKITEYILNLSHPVGGPKARWFVGLGYHPESPEDLMEDLISALREGTSFTESASPHGVKYAVCGRLNAPNGSQPEIVTVWIIEHDSDELRFVTAYPD